MATSDDRERTASVALPGTRVVGGDALLVARGGPGGEGPLNSCFVHVLEGYQEGEQSVLNGLQRLPVAAGPAAPVCARSRIADLQRGGDGAWALPPVIILKPHDVVFLEVAT